MRATGKYYWLNVGAEASFVLATGLMAAFFNLTIPDWPPFIFFFLAGAGYGTMLTITLLALISAVDHEFQAVVTSASYAFRSTGSTIGITIASAVFQNLLTSRLWARVGDKPDSAEIIERVKDSIGAIKDLPALFKGGVLDAYMDALRGVFLTTFGMALIAAIISLFMREHTLHTNLQRK